MCLGWLLDQKNRGVPSISLRLKLVSDDAALKAFEAVNDGGEEMYESAEEMCEINLELIHEQEKALRLRGKGRQTKARTK